jgi:hypothetical protein
LQKAVPDPVARVIDGLERLGLEPVLVGGMALVLLGSQRVTQDFDFVISHPREQIDSVVDLCYRCGLELVSKLNPHGQVVATIDNRKVAAVRLRLGAPASAFFYNARTFLRIDLLFDFPVAAAALRANSVPTKILSRTIHVAATADLLRLKEIAASKRSFPGDVQDIDFLKTHLRG